MMMMGRVMCVLAVVLCCACGSAIAQTPADAPQLPYVPDLYGSSFEGFPFPDRSRSGTSSSSSSSATSLSENQLEEKALVSTEDSIRSGASDGSDLSRAQLESEIRNTDSHEDANLLNQKLNEKTGHGSEEDAAAGSRTIEREMVIAQEKVTAVGVQGQRSGSEQGITSTQRPSESETATLSASPDNHPQGGEHENNIRPASPSLTDAEEVKAETGASTTTTQSTTQESNAAPQDIQRSANTKGDNSALGNSSLTQQSSPANVDETVAPDTEETNHTTPPSLESTSTEAPTTTPSHVHSPNGEITSIASAVQKNKANVDSSVSPVWMRTAAPLLIVVVLFSATLN
ncbi:uncharacterized protein TM35_001021020 [Trypanosoma theileri]|uniref:Mucin-associated surface protein (MASP) n=1 Tax=Trypanosoma theileri TaxID=67003 RepID=A0A1X0NE83_9TRYP|nr:uncharacterized protein TM35_001021020 [Trypanosoma theileri]ORC81937.1 hypothetical protein TM35_001021020 [Trypanosoma theileri]